LIFLFASFSRETKTTRKVGKNGEVKVEVEVEGDVVFSNSAGGARPPEDELFSSMPLTNSQTTGASQQEIDSFEKSNRASETESEDSSPADYSGLTRLSLIEKQNMLASVSEMSINDNSTNRVSGPDES